MASHLVGTGDSFTQSSSTLSASSLTSMGDKAKVMKRALRMLLAEASESTKQQILHVFKTNNNFNRNTMKQISDIVGADAVRAAFQKANVEFCSQRTQSATPAPVSVSSTTGVSSESAMPAASAAHAQNNDCFSAAIDASVRDTLDFGWRVNALREQLSTGDKNDSLTHTLFLRQTALR